MKRIISILSFVLCISFFAGGQIITTVAGNQSYGYGYSGDGGPATTAELFNPYDVQFDASGNMYIADESNCVIRMVNSSGIISTVAGNNFPGGGYSGDGGPATAAEMYYPTKIAFDPSGNMYITDYYNWVVRQVNTSGIISTVAGNHAAGNGYSGDGGPATAAETGTPVGVACDAFGNFYIGEYNDDVVRKVNSSGIISTVAGIGDFNSYSGDGGPATAAEMYYPNAVCFDASGNLYISDRANNVIRMVNSSGVISTVVGNPVSGGPLGGGYSGDGGPATAAELLWPMGIAFDHSGNMFIADMSNNVIREVNTSGIISTVVGNGQVGYSGDGGSPSAAELHDPYGVGFDASGNLYIADNGNQVIRKVNLPCTLKDSMRCTPAGCCNCNGTAHIYVYNGTGPYTYLWNNGRTNDTIANLASGWYSVSVTYPNGCSLLDSVLVRSGPPVTTSQTEVTCGGGNNGSATVFVSGNYSYIWAPVGGTNSTATGLSAGMYTVTVASNDTLGCSTTAIVNILQPDTLSVTAIADTNVNCKGYSTGSAGAIVKGGTGAYTYLWSDANSQTTITATGLSAGTYSVTVSDSCGGLATGFVTISQPIGFTVNATSVNPVSCFGGSNGIASAILTVPHVANYTMDTVVQHFVVPAGVTTITLTMVGAAGCCGSTGGNGANFIGAAPVIPGHVLSVVVGQLGSSNYEAGGGGASWVYDSTMVLYNPHGDTGLIAVAAGGGGDGYSYGGHIFSYGNGGPGGTDLVTNTTTHGTDTTVIGGTGGNGGDAWFGSGGGGGWLSNGGSGYGAGKASGGYDEVNHFYLPGIYANGGFGSGGAGGEWHMVGHGADGGGGGGGYNGGGAGLGGGGGASFFIDTLPIVTDSGTGNGFVRIFYFYTGYDSTYTYKWSNGETTYTATGLSAGTYTLTVSNPNGCSATTSVTITQPTPIVIVPDSVADNGSCNGAASVAVSGGSPSYTYFWTGGNTTDSIGSQCHGYYCCTVTDANGCVDSVCINIPFSITTGTKAIKGENEKVEVYPNPSSGIFTMNFVGTQNFVSASIEIYNVLGESLLTETLHSAKGDNLINLSNQPNGIYFYRVLSNNGSQLGSGKLIIQK